MTQLFHVETVTAPFLPYGADIVDLSLTYGGGMTLTAFAGSNVSARLVTFDISGTANFLSQTFLGATTDGFESADYGTVTLSLSVTRLGDVLNIAPGEMQDATYLTSLNNGQANDLVALVATSIAGATYLISSQPDAPGLAIFQQLSDGSLAAVAPAPDPSVGQISDLASVTAYGNTWILGTSLATDSVESYTQDASGALTHVGSFGAADGLGINTPVALSPILLDGQPYVVIGSSGSGSLSVLRLEADGGFTAIDHVLDDLNSPCDNTSIVESVAVGDAVFVLAAGSDDGFSLFRVRPDGRLHLLDSYADTNATALNNMSAAALGFDGSALHIFVSSSTEVGVSHFTYDLSALGITFIASSGGDVLMGTALDDMILGGAGDDTLTGGAGADIIVDGAGSDTLTGGTGADVFTFDPDGVDDTILDFERGIDALDLSFYPLLYDVQALGYASASYGASLSFQGEVLTIYSADGNPLSLAELTAINPLNVDRPALVLASGGGGAGGGQTQIGTSGDDTLVGTNLDDTLTGNAGDDVLIGGQGADALYGGIGVDTADYATATSGLVTDLANMSLNTGDAAGDTFSSIEVISGTRFDDLISGSGAPDTLLGQNGSDYLVGRGGDDTLDGGLGNDVLEGGAGADVLIGGDQTDTASYANAPGAVHVDLLHQGRNSGEAGGDSLSSIEDLAGSANSDALYGDGGANTLWGNAGNDWLVARAGNDALYGGAGDDVLEGGAGSDLLDGGTGTDRAQYMTSKQGLTINLGNSAANTGIAAGDTYVSIEDIAGSPFSDLIIGDGGANQLLGNGGNDVLRGAGGDDHLLGGAGADRIDGGTGNDLLSGGLGADVFVFKTGYGVDTVQDFDPSLDLIELSTSLLGGTAATGSAVLADYASLIWPDVVLDFGGGDSIIIEDISDLSILANSFAFA
jgi:Ca2+-binding RTX toxin-like protein